MTYKQRYTGGQFSDYDCMSEASYSIGYLTTGYKQTHPRLLAAPTDNTSRSSWLAGLASVSLTADARDHHPPNLLVRRPRNQIAYLGSRF